MKATRKGERFHPVVLTLQSQAEVDAIYALLNHVDLIEAVSAKAEWQTELRKFKSPHTDVLHTNLCNIVKAI